MQHKPEDVQHPTERLQQNDHTKYSEKAIEGKEPVEDEKEEKRTLARESPTWPVPEQSIAGHNHPPLRQPTSPRPATPHQALARMPVTPPPPSPPRPQASQGRQPKPYRSSISHQPLDRQSEATQHRKYPSLDESTSLSEDNQQTETSKVIMVVDDSQTVRNIMALILNRSGYRSIRVASAMEALQTLTELTPDLIFLDITLPGMDGLDVCKIIKENPRTKQVPVVMLSGNNEVFDKVMGRLAGASDYITKPFEPENILKCIQSFLGRKSNHREGLWQGTR